MDRNIGRTAIVQRFVALLLPPLLFIRLSTNVHIFASVLCDHLSFNDLLCALHALCTADTPTPVHGQELSLIHI